MGRKQCDNCGAPCEVAPEEANTPKRCTYCGALLDNKRTLVGLQRPAQSSKPMALVAVIVAVLAAVGIVVAVVASREPAPQPAPVSPAPSPTPPPVAVEPPPPPPVAPELPVARPPRPRTVHDDIRDFFLKADGKLCVGGNLSTFGPFAGSVQLTAHPEGRVSQLRVAMQPNAPKVTRCLQRAFSQGPVYRGHAVGVVYHFGGGRSADGLQFHDGVELKGSAE